jgi:hypothetical protein
MGQCFVLAQTSKLRKATAEMIMRISNIRSIKSQKFPVISMQKTTACKMLAKIVMQFCNVTLCFAFLTITDFVI